MHSIKSGAWSATLTFAFVAILYTIFDYFGEMPNWWENPGLVTLVSRVSIVGGVAGLFEVKWL